jgi:hypothetical protein
MSKRLAAALMVTTALTGAAQARSLVVAIPANMSPGLVETTEGFFADVFNRQEPRDTLVVFDASHLKIIAQVIAPQNLGTDAKARARVFGEAEGAVNDVIDEPDKSAKADDLNIPVLLRELGLNVIPKLPDHDPHVVLIGSTIWSDKDTNWSFKEFIPSDGFLTNRVGVFNVLGQETILNGALISICYTDKIDGFAWEGFRRETLNFWGKSLTGRGGKVGGFQPYAPDCAARLFSTLEDKTAYTIDHRQPVFLRKMHWVNVDVR